MKCPKCNKEIGRFELAPNCKHCGVNIFYAQQEALLTEDAKRCELEYATFHILTSKLKNAFIGGKMVKESFEKEEKETDASFDFVTMLIMAIATSIDALAVGVTFALLPDYNIWLAVSFIGIITFTFGVLGVKIGSVFGAKYKSRAELAGGIILVLMGAKILLEHLGIPIL